MVIRLSQSARPYTRPICWLLFQKTMFLCWAKMLVNYLLIVKMVPNVYVSTGLELQSLYLTQSDVWKIITCPVSVVFYKYKT